MTSTNCFGFNNCGPTGFGLTNGGIGCGPTGYGFNSTGFGYGPTNNAFNGYSPVGYGSNFSPIACGPTGYGFNNTGIGCGPTNYGFNSLSPIGGFTPGFSGQFPVNTWNTNPWLGNSIYGTTNTTPWGGQPFGGFNSSFAPVSNWTGLPTWNNWNTLGGIPSDNRFFGTTGYSPITSQWGNTTPWNSFGGVDHSCYGINQFTNSQFTNGITPWGFNPFLHGTNNLFGCNGLNTWGQNVTPWTTPGFTGFQSNLPFGLGAGYPLNFSTTGNTWNSTPWSGFVNPLVNTLNQFPFAGNSFNTPSIFNGSTQVGYNNPISQFGYNNPISQFGFNNPVNQFGYNSPIGGHTPIFGNTFGQGFSNSFPNGSTFQNYPYNSGGPVNPNFNPNFTPGFNPTFGHNYGNTFQYGDRVGSPVTNGTLGLNREAA